MDSIVGDLKELYNGIVLAQQNALYVLEIHTEIVMGEMS